MKPFSSVLIAEDDPNTRAQYRRALEHAADAVIEAEDGAEALGKAICHPPDLVVTRVGLRRIDGLALCRLLRGDPTTRHASIIVVSSGATVHDLSRARNAGADRMLQRPCTPERLLDAALNLRGLLTPHPASPSTADN